MDANRRQEYLNLIRSLLKSPSGKENEILNTNRKLVDPGLLQTMAQIAENLQNRGEQDTADFLFAIAHQLAKIMGLSSTSTSSLQYCASQLSFLLQILQLSHDTNGNRLLVYPLLKANLDKLNLTFTKVLSDWATDTLGNVEPEQAKLIAADLSIFSILIKDFPLGNRAINWEIAIESNKAVATFFTRQEYPTEWAACQFLLGVCYSNRILGERANNLENAITTYENALQIRTREAVPQYWAEVQSNLGVAYFYRVLGERGQNLEKAIQYYRATLQVITSDDTYNQDSLMRQRWAIVQNNLGNAYGKQVQNLKKAIQAYKAALQVINSEEFTQDWVGIQNNLGNIYQNPHLGEFAQNLEKAIECYKAALQAITREQFPEEWAMSQLNLAVAYYHRPILEERTKNLEKAILCCQSALEVYTREAFPQKHITTLAHLGYAYQEARQFTNAYTTFASAIDTVELLRSEIIFGSTLEEAKQKLAEQYNQIYQGMVEVCLELKYYNQALEYMERSKTRNLVERILNRDINSIFPPEIVNQLEHLRDEIVNVQYQLQNAKADEPIAQAQYLQQLQKSRNELQDCYLPIGYSFKFHQFQACLDENTAVVELYTTTEQICTLIFTAKTQQPIVVYSGAKNRLNKLDKWINGYLKAYNNYKSHWQRRLTTRLHLLAKILYIDEIVKQIPQECDHLILIPHRHLHLFPLHALPISYQPGESKPQILMDRFPRGVRYAPSCQLLQLAKTRRRPNFTHFFAIQNPTQDLTYADLEVAAIQNYFDSANILEKAATTKAAIEYTTLNTFHCVHFSCHGYFNSNLSHANKSALILANAQLSSPPTKFDPELHLMLTDGTVLDLDKCLTLDAIFSLKFQLDQCRLVVLSACETGLIDSHNTSDEYIGLVSGFLFAGSPSVVSSLWAVDQVSTAFLLIKFYENLKNYPELNEGDVAFALQNAQNWLRNLTCKGVEQELAKAQYQQAIAQLQQKLSPANFFELEDAIETQQKKLQVLDPNYKPFAAPYYWAAFIATGL